MKKIYETPKLNVTKFEEKELVMDVIGGPDSNDGYILETGQAYESTTDIDDLELFFG